MQPPRPRDGPCTARRPAWCGNVTVFTVEGLGFRVHEFGLKFLGWVSEKTVLLLSAVIA